MPSRSRIDARKSAAGLVSPGGLDVSIATYEVRSCFISSASTAASLAVTGACPAETEGTKVPTDRRANTISSRPGAGTRFMFFSVSFLDSRVLDAFSHRLEGSGVSVLSHAIPLEAAAVHRDVDAGRQNLDERQRAAQVEQPVRAAERVRDHRTGQHD